MRWGAGVHKHMETTHGVAGLGWGLWVSGGWTEWLEGELRVGAWLSPDCSKQGQGSPGSWRPEDGRQEKAAHESWRPPC